MFRGDLEVPGDMVFTDPVKVFRIIGKNKIVADARADKDLPDTGDLPECLQEFALEFVARAEGPAGRAAVPVTARTGSLPAVAYEAVHVCRWSADILNNAFETRHFCHRGLLP